MNDLKQIIAARLKSARQDANLTQSELADLLSISKSAYTHLENARNWVTIRRLVKIKEVLNRSADFFLGSGTSELKDDELVLLELYRSITDKTLKQLALDILQLLARKSRPRKRKRE